MPLSHPVTTCFSFTFRCLRMRWDPVLFWPLDEGLGWLKADKRPGRDKLSALISSNFIQNWSILVTAESPEQQVPFFIACSTQCSNFGGDWNAQETVSIRRLIKMGMKCNNTPRPRQGNGRVLRPGQAARPKKSIPSSARCIDCTNWHHLLWVQDWNGMNMNSQVHKSIPQRIL